MPWVFNDLKGVMGLLQISAVLLLKPLGFPKDSTVIFLVQTMKRMTSVVSED
jgi:hypothetical protein